MSLEPFTTRSGRTLRLTLPLTQSEKGEFARRTFLQLYGLNTERCKLCGIFRVTRPVLPYQGERLKSEDIARRPQKDQPEDARHYSA